MVFQTVTEYVIMKQSIYFDSQSVDMYAHSRDHQ